MHIVSHTPDELLIAPMKKHLIDAIKQHNQLIKPLEKCLTDAVKECGIVQIIKEFEPNTFKKYKPINLIETYVDKYIKDILLKNEKRYNIIYIFRGGVPLTFENENIYKVMESIITLLYGYGGFIARKHFVKKRANYKAEITLKVKKIINQHYQEPFFFQYFFINDIMNSLCSDGFGEIILTILSHYDDDHCLDYFSKSEINYLVEARLFEVIQVIVNKTKGNVANLFTQYHMNHIRYSGRDDLLLSILTNHH